MHGQFFRAVSSAALGLAALFATACVSQVQLPGSGDELFSGSPADFSTRQAQQEIETFLRTAEVIDEEVVPVGVTRPERLTLSDGSVTRRALWKILDEISPMQEFARGKPEMRFTDSYKHEIAAYELDKLLELNMVPPTVERRLGLETGCVQLWLDGVITETVRLERDLHAQDMSRWNQQMLNVRLFHQLIHDTDYNNVSNLLVDADFKIYIIDSSRAFRLQHELRKERSLPRFSRSLLERLQTLTPQLLDEHLGEWLTPLQIEALLARRDLIVALAERRVQEEGEQAVLYP